MTKRAFILALLIPVLCMAGAGGRHRAIIASVFDGDTCTALIYQGPGDWSQVVKIRLHNVWAPEMRGDTLIEARAWRDRLRKLILGREVVIVDTGKRSGGRWVADIELHGTNIVELLPPLPASP